MSFPLVLYIHNYVWYTEQSSVQKERLTKIYILSLPRKTSYDIISLRSIGALSIVDMCTIYPK